eukprot:gene26099-34121_t
MTLSNPLLKKRKLEGPTYTPTDIAHYFLALDFIRRSKNEHGIDISPLKLQKLLYYAQGYALASFGKALFEEDFLKWEKGPVVDSVYQEFSSRNAHIYRNQSIETKHCQYDRTTTNLKTVLHEYRQRIDIETQRYLNIIYTMFLHKNGEYLSDVTHNERPWKKTLEQENIQKEVMSDFFSGYPIFDFIKALQDFSLADSEKAICFTHNSLIFSSKEQLEEYKISLDTLENKIPEKILEKATESFCVFDGQTPSQAFLGTFFFPDLLERGFDHCLSYFQHRTIPTLLAFSAHYQNPIAFFYLSKLFKEFDYEDTAIHFLNEAHLIFKNTLNKQLTLSASIQNKNLIGVCHLYLSEIFDQQGKYEQSRDALSKAINFLSQSENSVYLVQIAKRITDVKAKKNILEKAYSKGDGDAAALLASLENSQEEKKRKLNDASSMGSAQVIYMLGGLMLQENSQSSEAINYLKEAIKKGSFSAAHYLAQKIPSEAQNAYDLASRFGFQEAYYQQYKRLIAQGDIKNAAKALSQAGVILCDENLLDIFPQVERDRINDNLQTYLENLAKISGLTITPRESISSSSMEEDELLQLTPDEENER